MPWQFGEVLGGIFRLRGGEGELQDGSDEGILGNLLRRGCCIRQCVLGWRDVRGSLATSPGSHGRVARGIQLMIGRLIIWGHLLAGTRQVPGRYKGKLLACDLTGAQMSLLEILVPGGFFFNFIGVNSSGKAPHD